MSYFVTEHNVETNKIVQREMNDLEIKAIKAIQAEIDEIKAQRAAKEAARKAVLEKLGLTADEAAALLG